MKKLFAIATILFTLQPAMALEVPKIGQIVNYVSVQATEDDGTPAVQPAIVTRVRSQDGKVALTIFYPSGMYTKDNVPFAETSKPGCWHK